MTELDQVKSELQAVRGLLETVMNRLDQVNLQPPGPALEPAVTMSELARDIARRGPVALHEYNARKRAAQKRVIKLRSID